MLVSYPVANFISIYIYSYGGFYAIWGTSLGLGVIALCYIILFIKDSRGHGSEENQVENIDSPIVDYSQQSQELSTSGTKCCCCGPVVSNLLECFTVIFKPRDGYKTACLLILLTSVCVFSFQSNKTNLHTLNSSCVFCNFFLSYAVPESVTYLYARKLFDWDQAQFALLLTVFSLTAVIGIFFKWFCGDRNNILI